MLRTGSWRDRAALGPPLSKVDMKQLTAQHASPPTGWQATVGEPGRARSDELGSSQTTQAGRSPGPRVAAEGTTGRVLPWHNDGVTIAARVCPVCGRPFQPSGRRRFCSDACRQAAWRSRHPVAETSASPPAGPLSPRRLPTVYECPSCGARYLDEQRCPDCHLFCRRIGPGGRCPHCDEPVAISDLIAEGEA